MFRLESTCFRPTTLRNRNQQLWAYLRRETPATVSQWSHDGELIPVLPEFEFSIGTFDSDQILYLVEAGKAATEHSLPNIHRLLQEPAAE